MPLILVVTVSPLPPAVGTVDDGKHRNRTETFGRPLSPRPTPGDKIDGR